MPESHLREELKVAERNLKEDFSEYNFLRLLNVLLLMGNVLHVERYLNLWREKRGEYPDSFKPHLALFYLRSLQIHRLKSLLPELAPEIQALIHLKVFADPIKAMELAKGIEDERVRARVLYEIGTVMGIPSTLPEPKNEIEAVSFKALRTLRDFYSGRLFRAVRSVDEMVDKTVDSWLRPTVIHVKEKELLLRRKVSHLHFLRLAAQNLGLRREAERIKVYERFLGEDVDLNIPEEDKGLLKVLELSERARGRIPPPSEDSPFFGPEAFWWYVSKVVKGEVYLSFSGRLRLVKGMEEVHLSRRKALVLLAFIRLKGYDFAKENAHIIFPESTRPRRRVAEYLRYIRPYMRVPIDVRIAKRFRTFLDEEGEGWAEFLRERAL